MKQLDQAARTWARTTIAAGGAPSAALIAAFGANAANATAVGIEELTTLPLATKQNYYTTVHRPQVGGAAKLIQHACRRYADATFPNCVQQSSRLDG